MVPQCLVVVKQVSVIETSNGYFRLTCRYLLVANIIYSDLKGHIKIQLIFMFNYTHILFYVVSYFIAYVYDHVCVLANYYFSVIFDTFISVPKRTPNTLIYLSSLSGTV